MSEAKESKNEVDDKVDALTEAVAGTYVAPAHVALADMLEKDADDKDMHRYKMSLIEAKAEPHDAANPSKVIVHSLVFCPQDRPPQEFLVKDLAEGKTPPFTIKEGSNYHFQIRFFVQHEITFGLKLLNNIKKFRVAVAKDTHVLGSYGPKTAINQFNTPNEEAPSGVLARGHYKCKAKMICDDQHLYATIKYEFEIKKDW